MTRDLRDHAGGADVAEEDLAVAGQPLDPLLDAGPGRVVDADDRAAVALGQVHQLDHLLGEGLAERAAEDGEVLREDRDLAAVDRAEAGDDAVAVGARALHAELVRAVPHERIELLRTIPRRAAPARAPARRACRARLLLRGGLVLGGDLGFEVVPAAGL